MNQQTVNIPYDIIHTKERNWIRNVVKGETFALNCLQIVKAKRDSWSNSR